MSPREKREGRVRGRRRRGPPPDPSLSQPWAEDCALQCRCLVARLKETCRTCQADHHPPSDAAALGSAGASGASAG